MIHNIEKVWEHKSNTCVVLMTDLGHRCGYVGISPNHSLYKKEYSDTIPEELKSKLEKVLCEPIGKRGIIDILCHDPENPRIGILFDVHGGITFSRGDGKYPIEKENIWWFGYDCAHAGDGKDLSVVSESIREIELMYPNNDPVRSLEYCIKECESLSDQLEEIK